MLNKVRLKIVKQMKSLASMDVDVRNQSLPCRLVLLCVGGSDRTSATKSRNNVRLQHSNLMSVGEDSKCVMAVRRVGALLSLGFVIIQCGEMV